MVNARRAASLARRLLGPIRRDLAGLAAAAGGSFPLRPGLYTYRLEPQGGTRRIHLRVATDRSAVLLVDVTDAIHLNPTAALLAKAALDGRSVESAIRLVKGRFRGADADLIERDARRIFAAIEHLATTTEPCPTCGLEPVDRLPPFAAPVSAPYKADLALGYGCNNACRHCYNEPQRIDMRSLSTDDWRRVLEKLAAVGIPNVQFARGGGSVQGHTSDDHIRYTSPDSLAKAGEFAELFLRRYVTEAGAMPFPREIPDDQVPGIKDYFKNHKDPVPGEKVEAKGKRKKNPAKK